MMATEIRSAITIYNTDYIKLLKSFVRNNHFSFTQSAYHHNNLFTNFFVLILLPIYTFKNM